jgi:hypothetical protein
MDTITISGAEGEDIIHEIFDKLINDQEHQELVEDIASACKLSHDNLRGWIEQVSVKVNDVKLKF